MVRRTALLCLSLLPLAGLAGSTAANPYADYLSARILPGWREDGGTRVAGLELTLAEGWKTYWRVPGSAGIPPVFDWRDSDNLDGVEIVWPRPEVFDQGGMRSIGYHDRVVLPLRIAPTDAGAPVELRGNISLGICDNVCVPMDVSVEATLPAGPGHRTPPIAAALAGRPYSAEEARVRRVTCTFTPARNGMVIAARMDMPPAGGAEVVVFETPLPRAIVSDAVTRREGGTLVARAKISNGGDGIYLDRSQVRITVLGRDYAVEIEGCAAG